MKVLITGGAGFIGSHLADRLLEKGHHVTCVDNFILGNKENVKSALEKDNFQLIELDLLELDELSKLFKANHFEFVYHLATIQIFKKEQNLPLQTLHKHL